jgi:hypothetical protein
MPASEFICERQRARGYKLGSLTSSMRYIEVCPWYNTFRIVVVGG